jgi:hypothetical protein
VTIFAKYAMLSLRMKKASTADRVTGVQVALTITASG